MCGFRTRNYRPWVGQSVFLQFAFRLPAGARPRVSQLRSISRPQFGPTSKKNFNGRRGHRLELHFSADDGGNGVDTVKNLQSVSSNALASLRTWFCCCHRPASFNSGRPFFASPAAKLNDRSKSMLPVESRPSVLAHVPWRIEIAARRYDLCALDPAGSASSTSVRAPTDRRTFAAAPVPANARRAADAARAHRALATRDASAARSPLNSAHARSLHTDISVLLTLVG